MKKLLLLLLLFVGLIGCSDADEKEQIEKKRIQTIKVEGNCMENHTTVKDVYEGSINLYVELPANIFFAEGYVIQKKPFYFVELLEEDINYAYGTYTPPLIIAFDELDSQDQDTIFKSKLKLNGLSNPSDPNKGGSNGKQYLSTCLFDVLEREKFNQ